MKSRMKTPMKARTKPRIRMAALVAELLGFAALFWGLYAETLPFTAAGIILVSLGLVAFALLASDD